MNERDTLTLTFTNMDLEGHPDCVFDYVEVSHSDLYFSLFLTLTFTNMDLEGHPDCVFDYVEVSHSDLYFSFILDLHPTWILKVTQIVCLIMLR